MESGAHAIGCPVIPGGPGNTEQQLEAIHHLKPVAYTGTPDFLKILLDRGAALGRDTSSLRLALVSGAALPASLRAELTARGVAVAQAYASADLGVIAYESPARDGLIVNEGLIVEIVTPGTGDPVNEGEIGEVVVTRLTADYPLLRFATGDLSAILPGISACGRTNQRLRVWLGRADQTTKIKGMFVHPGQIAELRRRHPEVRHLRLVVQRANEQDIMTLHAEAETLDRGMLAAGLADITKLRGEIIHCAPGSLPRDGKIIADERPAG